ncbi:MAG: TetR/AcrR family transcriptional regulator [Deltaproteobacteria bacterium]|nr:MAG: TetR/AcrR family transcriptional regulator [Deltaproteobacteria bacterium]
MGKEPDQRCDLLLDAAEKLFQHYGTQKTTVADIAREAEVGVGTVYLEFSSKNAIIEALSERRHRNVLNSMKKAGEKKGLSWSRKLELMLQARADGFLTLATEGTHATDLVKSSCKAVNKVRCWFGTTERSLLVNVLEGGQQAGEFQIQDPERIAAILQQALASFSPPFLYNHDPQSLAKQLQMLHQLLIRGLQAPGSSLHSS